MCISCGCGNYEDAHGDERNITVATLQRAAAASNLTLEQVVGNMREGAQSMEHGEIPDHHAAGQAVKERLRPDERS